MKGHAGGGKSDQPRRVTGVSGGLGLTGTEAAQPAAEILGLGRGLGFRGISTVVTFSFSRFSFSQIFGRKLLWNEMPPLLSAHTNKNNPRRGGGTSSLEVVQSGGPCLGGWGGEGGLRGRQGCRQRSQAPGVAPISAPFNKHDTCAI